MVKIGDEIICGICGKLFIKDTTNRRYCSPICATVAKYQAIEKNRDHAAEVRHKWVERNKNKYLRYHNFQSS